MNNGLSRAFSPRMAIFCAFAFLMATSVAISAQERQVLFTIAKSPVAGDALYSKAAVREAEIIMNRDAISSVDATSLEIPLFDGKAYTAQRRDLEIRGMGDHTWRGAIKNGSEELDVILTFKDGYVSGLIYSPEAVYEISTRTNRRS